MRSPLPQTILILSLILVTAAAVTAQTPHYELTVLEPIVLPEGDVLPVVTAWDINNAGQVAGTARTRDCRDYKSVGFLYTPGVGMEIIDPGGGAQVPHQEAQRARPGVRVHVEECVRSVETHISG